MVDCKNNCNFSSLPAFHLLGNVTLQHLLLGARIYFCALGSRVASWLSLAERMQGKTLCAKSESKPQEDLHYLYLFSWNPAANYENRPGDPTQWGETCAPDTPVTPLAERQLYMSEAIWFGYLLLWTNNPKTWWF